jgi:nucleotide-binding universal stress UspA family protein
VTSFRQILVATDYGPASEIAMETTIALATRLRANITVLHVMEESAYAYPFPTLKGAREAAQLHIDDAVASLRARSVSASGILREGFAWSEICACASEISADLVVVGSQGRRGLPRFMLGSVAERVVRLSPCPVLTLHSIDRVAVLAGEISRFRHILASTDFSKASWHGVEAAVNLALELDTRLTIVHVCEPPFYVSYVIDDVVAAIEQKARLELEHLMARVRAKQPKAEAIVRWGSSWQGILDASRECGADLIVLSTHGRHGAQRALVGSVAEKIVRLSPVPVLTLGVGTDDRPRGQADSNASAVNAAARAMR